MRTENSHKIENQIKPATHARRDLTRSTQPLSYHTYSSKFTTHYHTMSASTPTFVNAVNKNAIDGAIAKMKENTSFAGAAPAKVTAIWNPSNGLVTCPAFDSLRMQNLLELSTVGDDSIPTILSYCPLMVQGCYSFVVMIFCAVKNMQFDTYETDLETEADLQAFFNGSGKAPWSKGVDMTVTIGSSEYSLETLEEVANKAHNHCPSVELLEKVFDLSMVYMAKQVEGDSSKPAPYQMDALDTLTANPPAPFVEKAKGTWYCQNQCKDFPHAFMTIKPDGPSTAIPISNEAPIGPGIYANPVQACLFGAAAAHCHAVALQFAKAGHQVMSLQTTFDMEVNKRRVMGVDGVDTKAFPSGGKMTVQIESTASEEVALVLLKKCELYSLGYLGMKSDIPLRLTVVK